MSLLSANPLFYKPSEEKSDAPHKEVQKMLRSWNLLTMFH
ncbi:hypothetical protein MNB_SM-7-466 [hydrothermal vent metagenome]|uniref:Uncharacterized protein n=1 Tax=hydrothermal vent metagenome TaxID=652676 RepID=A0A1W1BTZ6_9ZZZZ